MKLFAIEPVSLLLCNVECSFYQNSKNIQWTLSAPIQVPCNSGSDHHPQNKQYMQLFLLCIPDS